MIYDDIWLWRYSGWKLLVGHLWEILNFTMGWLIKSTKIFVARVSQQVATPTQQVIATGLLFQLISTDTLNGRIQGRIWKPLFQDHVHIVSEVQVPFTQTDLLSPSIPPEASPNSPNSTGGVGHPILRWLGFQWLSMTDRLAAIPLKLKVQVSICGCGFVITDVIFWLLKSNSSISIYIYLKKQFLVESSCFTKSTSFCSPSDKDVEQLMSKSPSFTR